MLRQEGLSLPRHWEQLRPEQLTPEQFLQLTADLFGSVDKSRPAETEPLNGKVEPVWRKALSLQMEPQAAATSEEDGEGY